MNIKHFLKKIPGIENLYGFYRHQILMNPQFILYKVFKYHKFRLKKYSGVKLNNKKNKISSIILTYHIIEKGIAMPNMKLGFGEDAIMSLITQLNEYMDNYDISDSQFLAAVSAVTKYYYIHNELNFKLKQEINDSIQTLLKRLTNNNCELQSEMSKNDYFKNIGLSFDKFSGSRHSIRNFSGEIDVSQIEMAVKLANNTPSACNRQPTRIHLICDKNLISNCLSLQNGNRGFGHLADKLLIVTGDISTILGYQEFCDVYTNTGMYIMNLSYSLHFYKIAHCILNWYVLPKQDRRLRKLINISETETIMAFIICGGLPNKFKLASSPRRTINEILTIHN